MRLRIQKIIHDFTFRVLKNSVYFISVKFSRTGLALFRLSRLSSFGLPRAQCKKHDFLSSSLSFQLGFLFYRVIPRVAKHSTDN